MRNTSIVEFDNDNIHITSNIRVNLFSKIILIAFNLLLLTGILVSLYFLDIRELKGGSIVGLLILLTILFLVTRFCCWSLFGKEKIIITHNTICYIHDYGLMQTNITSLSYTKLKVTYNSRREYKKKEYGTIEFINYHENTNLPNSIFETAIFMPKDKAEKVIELIEQNFIKSCDPCKHEA